MAQPFGPNTNFLARISIPLFMLLLLGASGASWLYIKSDFNTHVHAEISQPVPFSHRHHVQGLGLDCRYCHISVERSSFAGMPDLHTCMTCHSQILKDSPLLAPVREDYARKIPIHWNRVYQLPEYVYFDHSIHVHKGVGCVTCHGAVSEMPLTAKARNFFMSECMECHRAPEKYLRPESEIFNEGWKPSAQKLDTEALRRYYGINTKEIIQCNVCHR